MFEYALSILKDNLWHRKNEAKQWKKWNKVGNPQQVKIHEDLAKEIQQAISILEKAGR